MVRALQPLRRKIPSAHRFLMDEDATAVRIAEEGVILPVLHPAPERWLEVSLVVDLGPSMGVWRQSTLEVRSLLQWSGAFRRIRVRGLETEDAEPWLRSRAFGSSAQRIRPEELSDSGGRNLVIVLSDCVSPAWTSGGMTRLLAGWAKSGPLAVWQVLPETMWARTVLGDATRVRLCTPYAGAANRFLDIEPHHQFLDVSSDVSRTGAVHIPVVSLDPDALTGWAEFLVGASGVWTSGVAWPLETIEDGPEEAEELGTEALVKQFRFTASPEARQLAVYLAALPAITLPLVRVIRSTMFERHQRVHEAEVLLSGLLEISGDAADPDEVHYDFLPGVREVLLQSLPSANALRLLTEKRISRYIEQHFGQVYSFRAILEAPASAQRVGASEDIPFAKVAAEILWGIGGDYAGLLQRRSTEDTPTDSTAERIGLSLSPGRAASEQLCLYCFETFNSKDMLVRCQQEDEDRCPHFEDSEFSKFWAQHRPLKQPRLSPVIGSGFLRQLTTRSLNRQYPCSHCGDKSDQLCCPHCHNTLPHPKDRESEVIIPILGNDFSGKTTYLGMLQYVFNKVMVPRYALFPYNQKTRDRYQTYTEPLANLMVLPGTRPSVIDPDIRHPLIFNLRASVDKADHLIVLYDACGSQFVDNTMLRRFNRNIIHSDAMMLLVDPEQTPTIRMRLLTESLKISHSPTDILNTVSRLIVNEKNLSEKRVPNHLAVVVSKLDLLLDTMAIGKPPLLSPGFELLEPSQHGPTFCLPEAHAISEEIESLLYVMGAQEIVGCVGALFESYAYFGVSALGFTPDRKTGRLLREPEPLRLLDPFLWILAQLDVVEAAE